MKLITKQTDVMSGQCANHLMRVQIGYTAWLIGRGLVPNGWSGLQIGLFAPSKKPGGDWQRRGFYLQLLPGMATPVVQWPGWYRRAWSALSWRTAHVA